MISHLILIRRIVGVQNCKQTMEVVITIFQTIILEFLIGLKKVKLKNILIKLKYMANNLPSYYQNYNFKKYVRKYEEPFELFR